MYRLVIALVLLAAAPAAAQDHTDVVVRNKQALLAQGENLADKCGAFKIVRAVVWELRGEGWGLVHSDGSGCVFGGDIYRADTAMLSNGLTIDMLKLSESNNGDTSNPQTFNIPAWDRTGDQAPANWRTPIAPTGPTPPPVPPPNTPPTPTLDLSGVYSRLDVQYQQALAGYQQAERVYTDTINRISALSAQVAAVDDRLRRHDEEPAWLTKVLSNRYVQLAMTAVGVYVAQHQLQTP